MQEDHRSPTGSEEARETARPAERMTSYEIPPEGSLGLLALGAVGITEWRYARERAKKAAEAETEEQEPEQPDEQPPVADD